ncbi:MAG: hypothetical protein J3K34DRAFT_133300 [Monoraphidium minutum]|nr:MAG: hypothetical protein J3K34DRAFT_133300 [Monoraphidium minutum]
MRLVPRELRGLLAWALEPEPGWRATAGDLLATRFVRRAMREPHVVAAWLPGGPLSLGLDAACAGAAAGYDRDKGIPEETAAAQCAATPAFWLLGGGPDGGAGGDEAAGAGAARSRARQRGLGARARGAGVGGRVELDWEAMGLRPCLRPWRLAAAACSRRGRRRASWGSPRRHASRGAPRDSTTRNLLATAPLLPSAPLPCLLFHV